MRSEDIITAIDKARILRRMSVRELAEKARCDRHTLTKYLNGQRKMVQLEIIIAAMHALGIEVIIK